MWEGKEKKKVQSGALMNGVDKSEDFKMRMTHDQVWACLVRVHSMNRAAEISLLLF